MPLTLDDLEGPHKDGDPNKEMAKPDHKDSPPMKVDPPSRMDYLYGRARLGAMESVWPKTQFDEKGNQFWVDSVSGQRHAGPAPDINQMSRQPRPDLMTGLLGSVAEDFTQNPLLYTIGGGTSIASSIINELMQGAPPDERGWTSAGVAATGGVGGLARAFQSGAHYGAMLGNPLGPLGHAGGAVIGGTLGLVPALVGQMARDPMAIPRAIYGYYEGSRERPPSQPSRMPPNQLQNNQ